jgi:hypothetical protein
MMKNFSSDFNFPWKLGKNNGTIYVETYNAGICVCILSVSRHVSISVIVQQDATLFSFYSLQTALHVSGDTFTHHQEHE